MSLTNKIDANNRTIQEVLADKKYTVDYFQREYSWEKSHIEQLITDLTSAFLDEYSSGDSREKGGDYNCYYLGPIVLIEREGGRSIIDGQQRSTSLTLFLIYLKHQQRNPDLSEPIESMIYSAHRGSKSFNLSVPEREQCLRQLNESGTYEPTDTDDESTTKMARRYGEIDQAFPEELKDKDILPFFIDWLRYNVVLVEIVTYSEENAYTIFETMNDRGLNLTPTEMLKGYILSNLSDDPEFRNNANIKWKKDIQTLHDWNKLEDQKFFQAWFRSQYAETIRSTSAGSQNEDFEKIGTRFNKWFRDNLKKIPLEEGSLEGFRKFLSDDMKFYLKVYFKILDAQHELSTNLEHLYYIHRHGIADSLSYPLLLAPITTNDDNDTVNKKLNMVARYIEIFVVRRSINYRRFSASSIRNTIYNLVRDIRSKDVFTLEKMFKERLQEMDVGWDGMEKFALHGQNKRFVKFFLSRITSFIEKESGYPTSFATYHDPSEGKPFEIEHIWADKFEEHRQDFEQRDEFDNCRNLVGGLLLLPQGTNQSFGAMTYKDKLERYASENLLVKSLCSSTYNNNPNFRQMYERLELKFQSHDKFDRDELMHRQNLYKSIAEKIWSL